MAATHELDRIDRRILAALQGDGRLTNQALSEQVALSPSACLARVRRLEQLGIIQGYHARLDPFAVDIGLILFAEVTLTGHHPEDLGAFEAAINDIPQIVEASHVTGDYDYLLKVVATDMNAWTAVVEKLTGSPLGVDRVSTHVLMAKPKIFVGYPIAD